MRIVLLVANGSKLEGTNNIASISSTPQNGAYLCTTETSTGVIIWRLTITRRI